MRILFLHQNFPGQFLGVAPALVEAGHDVRALCYRTDIEADWGGVHIQRLDRAPPIRNGHPWLVEMNERVAMGETTFRAAQALRAEGYTPDVIVAHPGWGEALFIKDAWPTVPLGLYAELHLRNIPVDPRFATMLGEETSEESPKRRLKNAPWQLLFDDAAGAISPTRFQADQFPDSFRQKIEIIHEGADTDLVRPDPTASISLSSGVRLTRSDEVITFVNRNLEPARGYHMLMRALPEILRHRPEAWVIVIGESGMGYGAPPPDGRTWKEVYHTELWPQLTADQRRRVRFVGKVPYGVYLNVLQVSSVHVYLTAPIMLSWSLLEAMSAGCAVVASDTPPVREVVTHDENGRLVDFFDGDGLAREVSDLLADPATRQRLGAQARALVRARYDRKSICVPAQMDWVLRLGGR